MWAAFGACARVRGFAAAAACGEAFGSKRVARRDGFAAAAACGEAFGSKRVTARGLVVSRRLVQRCGSAAGASRRERLASTARALVQ